MTINIVDFNNIAGSEEFVAAILKALNNMSSSIKARELDVQTDFEEADLRIEHAPESFDYFTHMSDEELVKEFTAMVQDYLNYIKELRDLIRLEDQDETCEPALGVEETYVNKVYMFARV